MDFKFTEEQEMLRDMAIKFGQNEIAPLAEECDHEEKYPREIITKGAENGLVGAWVPEEYGGANVGFVGNVILCSELTRFDPGIAINIFAATFGCEAIVYYGTEEQKKRWVPPCCRGELISAGAFTEPNAGTDVAGYRTRAVKDGGDYVINGNKMFITNGSLCDFYVTQCITSPEEKRHKKFSQIIIPADAKGVTRNKISGKMGIRASDTAEIAFEDVRVPQENLIGKEGGGFYQLMHFFDMTRLTVGAQGIGIARACLDASIKYAKERTAFGATLGSYQLTQKKLADMAIRLEALKTLVFRAAAMADAGSTDWTISAMAKHYSGEVAVFCANAAVEIHGGYGYIAEYPVQRWYRDAKILELYEGTKEAEIMTIARVLLS